MLQVFRTPEKGWGVRSPRDIAIGTFLCSYVGVVVTSDEAEQHKDADEYLFNLSHFTLVSTAPEPWVWVRVQL